MERLAWIRDRVLGLAFANKAYVVVLEGYSYGSKGQTVVNIGELGGVVRLALHEAQIPVVEIPPACLKKYACGRGNASKEDVLQAGVMRAGHTFRDNNACDAWWLHQMALAHYDPDSDLLVKVPAAQREALAKVAWPDAQSLRPVLARERPRDAEGRPEQVSDYPSNDDGDFSQSRRGRR